MLDFALIGLFIRRLSLRLLNDMGGTCPLTAEPRWDYRSSRSFSPRTFALHYFRPKSRLVTNQLFYLPKFTEVLAVTMSGEKRPAPEGFGTSHQLVVKRNKAAENAGTELVKGSSQNGALIQSVPRTSGLDAPIMELTGHSGEVFAVRFDPTAQHIASGAMDRSILLWNTYGQCENYGQLTGHRGAVLDLQWSRDSRALFSASADMTLGSWDVETGERVRRHVGHEEIINCLDISKRGQELLISGSDDGSIGIWDPRQKDALDYLQTELPITAVALSEAGNEIYSGGIDNTIHTWDIRKKAIVYSMTGHTDTITSLQISPDSQTLLSDSHDSTVRTWDIRPFAPTNRQVKTYDGAPVGLEKNLIRASWDPKGEKIAAGSGDRTVVVWEAKTGKLLYKLPGHKGTVNDVRFSPNDEPIIVSCSSDRNLILGELGK
ncbi:U5 snRNP complex subunit [Penicillium chrysogenum]|nr:U5 snRNP complex subunit [Penicillium chrysogenum]